MEIGYTGNAKAMSTPGRNFDIPRGPELTAVPLPQNEIARELDIAGELSNALVSELSTLCAVLDPILVPAIGAEGKAPGNPTSTRIGGQLNDINNRIIYAIEIVRNLRNNAAI